MTRTGGSDGPLTVNYAPTGGTATAGTDFTAFGGTLSFADGETLKTFTVVTQSDTAAEGSETVNLALTAPAGSTTQLTTSDPPAPPDSTPGAARVQLVAFADARRARPRPRDERRHRGSPLC